MLGLTYSPPVTDRSAGNTRQVTTEAGLPVGTLTIDRARGRVAFNRPDKQFTQWHRLPRLGDAVLDAVAYAREAGLLPAPEVAPVRTARLCKSHGWQALSGPIDPAVVDACPNCRVTTP